MMPGLKPTNTSFRPGFNNVGRGISVSSEGGFDLLFGGFPRVFAGALEGGTASAPWYLNLFKSMEWQMVCVLCLEAFRN